MKIGKDKMIAGLTAIKIRDALRTVRDGTFSVKQFGSERTQALLSAGLIERDPDISEWDRLHGFLYRISNAGIGLANSRFVPRLDRARTNKMVADFLQRVHQVNANSEYLNFIEEVRLFGSYIKDAADFGDIDVAIKLKRKYPGPEYVKLSKARADATGRNLGIVDRLAYGEREVKKFLKARSPYISLHDLDEVQELGCETVKVWPGAPVRT